MNSELLVLVSFILGLVLGTGFALWLSRRGSDSQDALEANQARLQQLEQELSEQRAANQEAAVAEATLRKELELSQKNAEEKLAQLQQAKEQMKVEFKELASAILKDNRKELQETGETQFKQFLEPVQKQFEEFKRRVEDVHHKDTQQRSTLTEQIRQLKDLHQQMSADAQNLTKALKGDAKMRGNWGEMILERVLETSGLTKGREYEREVASQHEDGSRYRPDAVIHLPEGKDVIVDAKVSLVAYERYTAAEDDAERDRELKNHIQGIKTHLKQLSEKRYDDLENIRSLDFVLMFVPIESALQAAWQDDANLVTDAFEKRVFMVTPTTLLAVLRVVENLWRYDAQNKYAMDIAKQGGDLYDKFVNFVESLTSIGNALDRAQDAYTQARKQLVDGRGDLVGRVERLKKLGAKAAKQLPPDLLEASGDAGNDADDEIDEA